MMKRIINYMGLVCLALCAVMTACDERTPDLYSAPNGIYFNNRTATNQLLDSTALTFVYSADDVMSMDVPVAVQSIGRQTDYDRPVNIRVYSDNAEEGVDYELMTPAVLPAHTSSFNYVIRVKRTAAIRTEVKSIYLELFSNDEFTTILGIPEADGKTQTPGMLKYRIDFADFYSTAPLGWRAEYVGAFSERKLRLLWKLFDTVVDRADYNVPGRIPFNRWIYLQREVENYMDLQAAILNGYETRYELDLDALVDPEAEGDQRRLLDFSPVVSD